MYVTDENSTQKVYDKKGNETEINPNSVILSINSTEDYKIHIDTIDGTTTCWRVLWLSIASSLS